MPDNLTTQQVVGGTSTGVSKSANELSVGLFAEAVQILASDATTTDNRVPASTTLGLRVRQSPAGTATLANVAGSIASVTLLAANANRVGVIIVNDSASILYVKFGATASATSLTYIMAANATITLPDAIYTGVIDGVWASAVGAARITELTT